MAEAMQRLSIPRDPLRLALFTLMFFTISRGHEYLGLVSIRPGLLLAGFAALYALLNPATLSFRALRTWPAWVMFALGILALASLPFGISPGGSAQYFIENYSKVLMFAALILISMRSIRDVMFYIVAYVLACGLLIWMALTVFDLSVAPGGGVARLSDMFGYDSNDAGLVLVTGIPLCLLLLQTGGRALRLTSLSVLIGSGWMIALTGSRGTFVAVAVVGLGLLIFLNQISVARRAAIVGLIVGGLTLAAPPGYWNQMSTILTPTADYNWSESVGRKAIAERGIGYMLEYPVFGVGLNNFGRAEGTISPMAENAMPGVGVRWTAPHNSYIQVAAELGIPGALLFSTLVFGGMFGMNLLRRRIPPEWEQGTPEQRFLRLATRYLLLSYLGFAVAAFFLTFAYLDPIYVLSAFSAGVYAESRRLLRDWRASRPVAPHPGVPGMRGGLTYSDAAS